MITVAFRYAYLILTVPFLVAWAILFVFSKNTRREQLIMSIISLPLGIIYEILYFHDYWNPASILFFYMGGTRIVFEDFLFSFAIIGIGVVIYEAILGKRLANLKNPTNKTIAISCIIAIAVLVTFSLFFLGMNSIFATSLGFVAAALFIMSQRRGLLVNSLISGLAVMVIMFVSYYIGFRLAANSKELIQRVWFLYGTPLGVRIWGVPATEMVWGFAVGMFYGPLYEFVKGVKNV